jgi:endonuclease G
VKNRKSVYTIIVVLIAVGFYMYDNYVTESDTTVVSNAANFNFLPTSTTGEIVHHNFYSLSYNETYEQAEWVAYELTKQQISASKFKRPYFIKDSKVTTQSAHYKNYSKTGYDKGHLCPAGDRKFSKKAHDETFLTSNISPQNHEFNSGIWNRLEQKTRYWATKYDKLYIVTGGILTNDLKTIGTEKVAVPNYFYKILLDYTKPEIKAIAFLIPHKNSDKALYKFVTSIDEIENLTNIDFFPNLEDNLEQKLEKSSNYLHWSFY